MMDSIRHFIRHGSLVVQIFMGLVVGIALAMLWPEAARATILFGTLFVGALKAVAPLLVAAMPEPQRTAASIEWEYSNALQRNNPFVAQLGAALGLDDAGIDALFIAAAKL